MSASVERVAGTDGKSYPASYTAHRAGIRKEIEADPGATNTAIAKRMHASRDTVIDVRKSIAAESTALVDGRYVAMCTAIAECHRVDEVKDLRDKALALEIYAKQAKNTDAERKAADIRLRAERRAGMLLKDLAEAEMRAAGPQQGTPGPGRGKASSATTLSEMGVTRDQSSKWQKLAAIPEAQFEEALRDPVKKPSTAALIREAHDDAAPIRKMPDDVLWIWGRVRDFERDGFMSKNPSALLDAMTDTMQADVRRVLPGMVSFLSAMLAGEQHEA